MKHTIFQRIIDIIGMCNENFFLLMCHTWVNQSPLLKVNKQVQQSRDQIEVLQQDGVVRHSIKSQ